MQCQNCKSQLPDSAKFCNKCGVKVNVTLCPNGHVIEASEKVCKYCPSSAATNANRMSVSTTIENLTVVEKQPGKTTVIEGIQASNFGKTSVIQSTPDCPGSSNETICLYGWLVITDGKDLWKDFRINKAKMSIGRSSECDIIVNDEHLSAKHASLKLQDSTLFITDLDSSNGTFVNSQEITRAKLSDNDSIKIGNTSLKFKQF